MNKALLVAATMAITIAPAAAQTIPRYDVDAYCTGVADFVGGSSSIKNTCVDSEQQDYDFLKSRWSSVGTRAAEYCDEVARFTGGSYSILKTCIETETDAADAPSTFKY